jgi:hypothetical protein
MNWQEMSDIYQQIDQRDIDWYWYEFINNGDIYGWDENNIVWPHCLLDDES